LPSLPAFAPASRSQHSKEMWVLSPSRERSSKDLRRIPLECRSQPKIFRWLGDHRHVIRIGHFPAYGEGAKAPYHTRIWNKYISRKGVYTSQPQHTVVMLKPHPVQRNPGTWNSKISTGKWSSFSFFLVLSWEGFWGSCNVFQSFGSNTLIHSIT